MVKDKKSHAKFRDMNVEKAASRIFKVELNVRRLFRQLDKGYCVTDAIGCVSELMVASSSRVSERA